jgi:hypothetical protein
MLFVEQRLDAAWRADGGAAEGRLDTGVGGLLACGGEEARERA